MAYVDFAAAADRPMTGESAFAESGCGDSVGLGPDEWSVVELSRNDGIWSLNPDGLPQRLARILFGFRTPRPLANERLEQLRRFAVVAWRKGAVGASHLRDLAEAGFSYCDARRVLDHVARRRQIQSWPRGLA